MPGPATADPAMFTQLAPPLVDSKTPPSAPETIVPAKRCAGLFGSRTTPRTALAPLTVVPLLDWTQDVPPFVVL